jgi:hypothetical protein
MDVGRWDVTMGQIIRIGSEALIGGENNTGAPHTLGLSEAASTENLDPRDWRGAKTRNGRAQYGIDNGSNTGVHGIKAWTRDAGTNFVVARIATTFYDVQASAWSSIGIGGTDSALMRAAALNNILVIVVDGMDVSKWNGATFATVTATGTPTEAKYACIYVSKLILAGDDANAQTIYGSATNNPENFTATNEAFTITSQDGGGDTIQGLAAARNWCNIFFRYYTEMLLGTSVFDFRVERLIDRGLVSQTGYASSGDVVFFASDEAVYMVARGMASDLTTLKQREWYQGISDKTKITLLIKGDLLLVVDYGTTGDYARAYDFKNGRWAPWPSQPWMVGDTSNAQVLYAGTDTGSTAQIWKLDTGSLDGTATITAFWRTGNNMFGWPDCPKNMAEFRAMAKPGLPTVTAQFYKNGASVGSTKTMTFASTGGEAWDKVGGMRDVRGRSLGVKLSWTGQGTLMGFAFYGEMTSDTGEIPVEV